MINLNQIYNEDCCAFMDMLSAKKILMDVIVTSPPYNMNKEYRSYQDNRNEDDYLTWLENICRKIKSRLKKDGSFFLNIAGRPSEPALPFKLVTRLTENVGFKLQNTIHWIKSISFDSEDIGKKNGIHNDDNVSIGHFKPIVSARYLSDLHEYVFHFTKTGNVKLDKLQVGVTYQDKTNIGRWKTAIDDKRDRGNVWFIPYPTIQQSRPHPAVFPVKLPERCIELHGTRENMLVYDPFMGIGSTALACIRLKVNYIGTEIDSQYIAIANQRITGYTQTNLSMRE
ncbi:MAG TPA: site-specific DNA-methyltransferase [Nitrososphaeraceae archaeon]|jgi:site-specific DNA-methyltransferase (adenine-specific)